MAGVDTVCAGQHETQNRDYLGRFETDINPENGSAIKTIYQLLGKTVKKV